MLKDQNYALALADIEPASRSVLVAEWRRLFHVEPPRFASLTLLRRAVAYAIQERELSGLPTAIRRDLLAIGRNSPPFDAAPRQGLKHGTKLLREWHSTTHEVLVTEEGFAWQGRTYRSLSAVAFAITGAKWNGHRFFGLRLAGRPEMAERKRTRCAIYTRKSSEEGLDQDFNSLDAQREACEAYVLSQKHERWSVVADRYDDGGFSGGNLERPGLVRLLADVKARLIDVIVVYKVDRLTRSLADFAKIVEVLDAQGISFVAVTQQFNTTTSMGRLTLNVLLSFAQFEREIAGERIRDKIKASRQKGMWMGGSVPLGYEVKDRALIVNSAEADKVRLIYNQYLVLGAVPALTDYLDARSIRSHRRQTQSGRWIGGSRITRGSLYVMLRNPIYVGQVVHKGATYQGLHQPIIDRELWNSVQARLDQNSFEQSRQTRSRSPSLLAGLLFDSAGERLTPTHTNKSGARYRYYVSHALVNGKSKSESTSKLWRIPAQELETAVASQLRSFLEDHCQLPSVLELHNATPGEVGRVLAAASTIGSVSDRIELRRQLQQLVTRVVVDETTIAITLDLAQLNLALGLPPVGCEAPPYHTIVAGLRVTKRGVEQRLIFGSQASRGQRDPALIKAVARAYTWLEEVKNARVRDISDLARREKLTRSYVQAHLPLAFLSPSIVKAILEGRQPPGLSLKQLMTRTEIAADWSRQWRQLGFGD